MGRLIGSVGLAPGSDEGTDLTTKGDIHGYSSSNTRIPVGDDDTVLTADSGEALGVKWASAGGGATVANVTTDKTSIFTTTSTSFVDITGLSLTKSTISGGISHTCINATVDNNVSQVFTALNDNGAVVMIIGTSTSSSSNEFPITVMDNSVASGTTAKGQMKVDGNTGRMVYASGEYNIRITQSAVG